MNEKMVLWKFEIRYYGVENDIEVSDTEKENYDNEVKYFSKYEEVLKEYQYIENDLIENGYVKDEQNENETLKRYFFGCQEDWNNYIELEITFIEGNKILTYEEIEDIDLNLQYFNSNDYWANMILSQLSNTMSETEYEYKITLNQIYKMVDDILQNGEIFDIVSEKISYELGDYRIN